MQTAAPIDCDVHPAVPSLSALMPYLDEVWRDTVIRRGIDELNTISYPSRSPLTTRADWRDDAGKAATIPQALVAQGLGSDAGIGSLEDTLRFMRETPLHSS